MKVVFLGWLFFFVSIFCGRVSFAETASERTTLHVALFPYLPDAAGDHLQGLRKRIQREFESEHPEVQLILDPLDPASAVFYDTKKLKKLLASSSKNPVDLLEIDTLFLGELVKSQLIEPWPSLPHQNDWYPAAKDAAMSGGRCYAVPHWLCSFFIFSPIAEISQATTLEQFLHTLKTKASRPIHLRGNFSEGWTLPAIYLMAYAQTYPSAKDNVALAYQVDPKVVASMKALIDEGSIDGTNRCIDGSLESDKDIEAVVPDFAHGKIDAFFGYAERLHYILKNNPQASRYAVIAAPFGKKRRPLLYVDAFVLRKGVSPAQRLAAKSFVDYMNRPSTYAWILLSQDAEHPIPRYLLPATKSAFHLPEIQRDFYYKNYEQEIAKGCALPTSGYWERAGEITKSVLHLLKNSHKGSARKKRLSGPQ